VADARDDVTKLIFPQKSIQCLCSERNINRTLKAQLAQAQERIENVKLTCLRWIFFLYTRIPKARLMKNEKNSKKIVSTN
jgi:hypothetical protein